MSVLSVSVLIRVRDEADALREVLARLREQVFDGEWEIVVLDNESRDDSVLVAIKAGARVFTFPREHFGYGRALNLGIEFCRGEVVVLLSAHSVPQAPTWLAQLVEPLRSPKGIGAVFCRQVPPTRVSRLEARRFACFPAADTVMDRERFVACCARGLDPYEAAVFSNSACAVRREAAVRTPFRDLPYAEDRAFIVDHLMSGGAVAYRHRPTVSYDRRLSWNSAYRVACRAQASKRLIRELAATYTGYRFDSRRDTADRLLRAVLVLPGFAVRVLTALCEPGVRLRGVVFAARSTGATLGLARGSLIWKRYMDTLSCDPRRLAEARAHCVEVR